MNNPDKKTNTVVRPPVVVIMGHIDHGKSTLLDYIRKTNVVAEESGGITQRISAYEVRHNTSSGEKRITFLDTPGHEAFSKTRERGVQAADVAVLIVSAEEGVKSQTLEAFNTIKESGIPFIVAINKIDKPAANPEKTKMDLVEKGVYLEGYGGDVPYVPISAKGGEGVDQLLDMILLVAELAALTGSPDKDAEGFIIESHLDPKRGISATLIIKDGTLKKGMYTVVEGSISATRIMEDFLGKQIAEATFSSPVSIIGFDKAPPIGAHFRAFENKKEAEEAVRENIELKKKELSKNKGVEAETAGDRKTLPIILKADSNGSLEALEKEVVKLNTDKVFFKVIGSGVGAIGETDMKLASSDKETMVVGFNVKIDPTARELKESSGVWVETAEVIYKLSEKLAEEAEKRRPRVETMESIGKAKVQKLFSQSKGKQIVGGKVLEGKISEGGQVKIIRREAEIGKGRVASLEQSKIKAKEISEGSDFGMQIESKIDIAPGDILEAFSVVQK